MNATVRSPRLRADRSGRGGPVRSGRASRLARYAVGYAFVAPIVAFFLTFVLYPFLRSFYISLTQWSGFGVPRFVGLMNFANLLDDEIFWQSLRTTLVFTVVSTVLQTVLPMALAILLAAGWRGSVVFRTVFFMPQVVSLVVSGLLWQMMYDGNFGLVNRMLTSVGLGGLAHNWLADPGTVLPAILVVSLWQSAGFYMLVFFAGLQGIDQTLYEAARVDGASKVQEILRITVPMLAPVTGVVVTLNVLGGVKVFELIYVMTGGGPNHASEVLGTYLYGLAFGSTAGSTPAVGYATAVSVVVFVLGMAAVGLQFAMTRRARDV
ncbi:carbohydrate ABC transporter permease [Actinopolymorpha pittospori]